MTTSFTAMVPPVVATYFEKHASRPTDDHPIIVGHFRDHGWFRSSYKKRVSSSWIRKLKAEGVTYVRLAAGGVEADFHVDEILKNESILHARRRSTATHKPRLDPMAERVQAFDILTRIENAYRGRWHEVDHDDYLAVVRLWSEYRRGEYRGVLTQGAALAELGEKP